MKHIITIEDAYLSLCPNVAYHILDGEVIYWGSDVVKQPTKKQIEDEIKRLQKEYDSKEYQRLRMLEYPSMQEQLDMQYHDSISGTTVWQDTIQAIKDKYPKPE